MTGPDTSGYQPFPAFADWAAVPVDLSTFDGYEAVLDELRARPDAGPLNRAVEVATRAAAIDTGAIEGLYEVDRGFTMTVARGVAAWEKVIAAREPVVRRSFEDALRAYDFVLDLATSRTEVSEMAIRQIHELICEGQETYRVVTSIGWQERPLPKGRYKDDPNNPVSRLTGEEHAYAPPIDVPAEMDRLVRELRSAGFRAAHPVLQAAWAHYAFVAVHPFADGNGRVARGLASVFLYRRPGVPLVIFADQKDAYLDGLEQADGGDPAPFVRFILERAADVIGLVQVAAQGSGLSATSSIASLREAMLGRHGLTHTELDVIAGRLLAVAHTELVAQLAALDLPPGVAVHDGLPPSGLGSEGDYRQVPDLFIQGGALVARLGTTDVRVAAALGVRVRRNDTVGPMFEVVEMSDGRRLTAELRELYPAITAVLELKLRMWIQGIVERLLTDLDLSTRQALHQQGYM